MGQPARCARRRWRWRWRLRLRLRLRLPSVRYRTVICRLPLHTCSLFAVDVVPPGALALMTLPKLSAAAESPRTLVFVVSCEHAGKRIPTAYRHLFVGQGALLASHRGYDRGALTMARYLSAGLAAPLVCSTVSRLLIDLNRSLHHRQVFSGMSRAASAEQQLEIITRHYLPYRARLESWVRAACNRDAMVVHVSSHSFTPILNGLKREADIGLLFDPKRRGEARLCRAWQAQLAQQAPALRVRRNYPYEGANDGLTRYLRQRFAEDAYIGIELEINQSLVMAGGPRWPALRQTLVRTLGYACAEAFHSVANATPHPQESPDAASRRFQHAVHPPANHGDDFQPEYSLVPGFGRDRA